MQREWTFLKLLLTPICELGCFQKQQIFYQWWCCIWLLFVPKLLVLQSNKNYIVVLQKMRKSGFKEIVKNIHLFYFLLNVSEIEDVAANQGEENLASHSAEEEAWCGCHYLVWQRNSKMESRLHLQHYKYLNFNVSVISFSSCLNIVKQMTQIWGRDGKRLYAGNQVSQRGRGMK